MTKTKRKRLYVESGDPQPGEWITLARHTSIHRHPGCLEVNDIVRDKGRNKHNVRALVVGLSERLDWMFIMTEVGSLGWVRQVEWKEAWKLNNGDHNDGRT